MESMETIEAKFADFCRRWLGLTATDPLPQSGTTLKSLLDIFSTLAELASSGKQAPAVRQLQDFSDSIYDEPNVCYVIHQLDTGRRYIGKTATGFRTRYSGCRWWEKTHSKRLADDVQIYGLASFRVHIYVCANEQDMDRTEASLLTAHRLYTYNIRREPDNANQAPPAVEGGL